jgi:hypothetical protein
VAADGPESPSSDTSHGDTSIQAVLEQLAIRFQQAADAHQVAFAATSGTDAHWASWYAHYLMNSLAPPLKLPPTQTQLARSLTMYDLEHRRLRNALPWPAYYALRLVSEYGLRPN